MRSRTTAVRFEVVEQVPSPLGELTLRRYRLGDEVGYEIRLEGRFLMATHGDHSERALARLAWDRLGPPRSQVSVLVGGLGVGMTLDAVLRLPGIARVRVTEVAARVVDWNRTLFRAYNHDVLDDPRVEVVVEDLNDHLAKPGNAFDLILLDVDNGPANLAVPINRRLYDLDALRRCRERLTPGGVLGVWSSHRDRDFGCRFEHIFGNCDEVSTANWPDRGDEPADFLYFGVRWC